MAEGVLSLKWSRHSCSFIEHLAKLRSKKLYSDVTVVCDGQYYHLHRFVLALCSRYFSEIFDTAHSQHPIIILNNIKCSTLDALLDFIYVGETQVIKEELPLLIKAAENLQVLGLSPSNFDKDPCTSSTFPENESKNLSTANNHEKESSVKLINDLEWKCYKNSVAGELKRDLLTSNPAECKSVDDETKVWANTNKRSHSYTSLASDKKLCLDLSSSEKFTNDNIDDDCMLRFQRNKQSNLLLPTRELISTRHPRTNEDEHTNELFLKGNPTAKVTGLGSEKSSGVKLELDDSSSTALCNEVSVSLDNSVSDSVCPLSVSPNSLKHERHFLDLFPDGTNETDAAPFFENNDLNCSQLDASREQADYADMAEKQGSTLLHCALCPFQTPSQPLLKLHSLSHADQMTFNSELSSFFNRESSVISNKRSTFTTDKALPSGKFLSSERSFPCLFCNYVATQRSNLAKHIRIHTGEKPFACVYCPYRCTQKHHLSRHMARQHRPSVSM